MAIGRRPPFGLGTATKLAPAKKGAAAGHAWPLERKDTKVVSWSKKESVLPGRQASRRCWTRRPDGPGAEEAGKLRKARPTRAGVISGPRGKSCAGVMGMAGWTGWRLRRAATLSGVSGASPSARRAAQALPSNPSRARLMAKSCRSAAARGPAWRTRSCRRLSQRVSRSPASQRCSLSRVYAAAALACLWPPRGGASRTVCGSISSSCQERGLLLCTAAAKARERVRVQRLLAAAGMWRRVRVRPACMSAKDGRASPPIVSSAGWLPAAAR